MLPVILMLAILTPQGWLTVIDDEAGAKGHFADMASCEQAKLQAISKIQTEMKNLHSIVLGDAFCFTTVKSQSE